MQFKISWMRLRANQAACANPISARRSPHFCMWLI